MSRSISKINKFKDKYMKRRTVEAGKLVECPVIDIGMINSRSLGIIVKVADDKFLMKVSDDEINEDQLYNLLLDYKNNKDVNKSINIVFNKEMDTCGFSEDEYKYDCELIKNADNLFTDNYDIDLILNKIGYNRSETKRGWKNDISKVSSNEENLLNVTIKTNVGTELNYELNIPVSTEPEASEVTRLIEEEGGGQPDLLVDGGQCVIVHKSDTKNLDIVSYDDSDEWALVVPSTHNDWIKNKKYEPSKNNTNKSTSSSSFNKNTDIKRKGEKILMQTFLHVGFLIFTKTFILNILLTDQMMSLQVTELLISMIDFSILILPLLGVGYFLFSRMVMSSRTA